MNAYRLLALFVITVTLTSCLVVQGQVLVPAAGDVNIKLPAEGPGTISASTFDWRSYFDKNVQWKLQYSTNKLTWSDIPDFNLKVVRINVVNGYEWTLKYTPSSTIGFYRVVSNVTDPSIVRVSSTATRQVFNCSAGSFYFDWSGAVGQGFTGDANYKSGNFWWSSTVAASVASAGKEVAIDPVTVGTSATANALQYVTERKSFNGVTRFWQTWCNSTDEVYASSTDGVTWSGRTIIRAGTQGKMFSIWYDAANNKLSYCYADETINKHLYYRRGTPASNGVITWDQAEQDVETVASAFFWYPSVAVDSSGHPYISYRRSDNNYVYVTRSSANNGTWATSAGFPYQASTAGSAPTILPLTLGKMLVVYATAGATIKAREYDGSSVWGAEKATAAAVIAFSYFSAAPIGDVVHMVYTNNTAYCLRYANFDYAANAWSAETTITGATTATTAPALTVDSNTNTLCCFWMGTTANHIYYKRCVAGSWDAAPTDWITDATLTDNNQISTAVTSNGLSLVAWLKGTSNPYSVRFAVLTLPVFITITSSTVGDGFVTVDGAAVTTPHSNFWSPGDTYTLAANNPANLVAGHSQYVYTGWSDAGAQSHTYTVPGAGETVTVSFQLQYYMATSVSPPTGGTVSAGGWVNSGGSITATAAPAVGWNFSHWLVNGVNVGSDNPKAVTAGAATTIKAVFVALPASLISASGLANYAYIAYGLMAIALVVIAALVIVAAIKGVLDPNQIVMILVIGVSSLICIVVLAAIMAAF